MIKHMVFEDRPAGGQWEGGVGGGPCFSSRLSLTRWFAYQKCFRQLEIIFEHVHQNILRYTQRSHSIAPEILGIYVKIIFFDTLFSRNEL